jgi:hypothetical protein
MKKILVLFLFVLLIAAVDVAGAATLYYSNLSGTDTQMYSIDSTTGADSLAATITGVQFFDLATSGIANTLYGIDVTSGTGCLYTTNVTTFSATLVGCAGVNITGIGYDKNANVLYGTDQSNLYTINTTTGASTLVGSFGGPVSMWAMGFDQGSNTLYCVDENTTSLYSINTATGAATLIGATGQDRITDIHVDPATGNMYGVGNNPADFYLINKATGAATIISGITGTDALGLAGAPVAPAPQAKPVPTLSWWGIIIFMIMTGLVSLYAIRRQLADN